MSAGLLDDRFHHAIFQPLALVADEC